VAENIHRTELTEADEADAYHQLPLTGGGARQLKAAGASYVVNDLSELLQATSLSTGSLWGACQNRRAEGLSGFCTHLRTLRLIAGSALTGES